MGAKEALTVVRPTVTDFKEENLFSFVLPYFLLSPSERLCPEGESHWRTLGIWKLDHDPCCLGLKHKIQGAFPQLARTSFPCLVLLTPGTELFEMSELVTKKAFSSALNMPQKETL